MGTHTRKRQRQRSRKRNKQRQQSRKQKSFNKRFPKCPTYPKLYKTQKQIAAGKDFFQHINGNWIKSIHLEPTETSKSVSSEIQRNINNNLLKLIIKSIKTPYNADRHAVAQFAKALYNKQSGAIAQNTVQILLNQVDCLTGSDTALHIQIAKIMGIRTYKGMFSIFGIGESPEEKHSKHIRMTIYTTTKGLPNKEYYLKPKIFNYYKFFLKTIGSAFHFEGLEQFADLEKKYVDILDNADEEDTVTMIGKSIQAITPTIPWIEFMDQLGINRHEFLTKKYNVYSKKWLKYVNTMFKTYSVSDWKIWLRASLIISYAQFLPPNLNKYNFHLYNYLLNGQQKPSSHLSTIVSMTKENLEIPLSRIYIDEFNMKDLRNEMRAFMETIRDATIQRIQTLEWMNPKTRLKAAAKVRNINFGVLYITQSYNYNTPQLGSNVIENLQILGQAYMDRALTIVRKKYSTDLWDEVPVYNVNAYYMSAGNRLFIPAAIATWPFYCSGASIGWNYGALGSVIGHEITHAFDDNGREFDQYGNRADWWTEGDIDAYEKKTRDIIALFNKSRLYGRNVDGKQTLSENIADLGGIAISLEALKKQLEKRGANDTERLQMYRDFFEAFATSWREKERKEHCIRKLILDVHSPAIFRVNNIVAHFQEFYDAYNICVKDPMYIEPDKRLTIF